VTTSPKIKSFFFQFSLKVEKVKLIFFVVWSELDFFFPILFGDKNNLDYTIKWTRKEGKRAIKKVEEKTVQLPWARQFPGVQQSREKKNRSTECHKRRNFATLSC